MRCKEMKYDKKLLSCEDVENILIKQNIENITEKEQQLIENHLISCEKCKKYEYVLLKLKNTLSAVHKDSLIPNPSIRKTLSRKMAHRPSVLNNIWHFILDLCEYRIPVYQALGVIGVVVLISIAFNPVGSSPDKNIDLLKNSISNSSFLS